MAQRFSEKKVICLICRQADLVDGLAQVNFERGEMKFVVRQVPARICPMCGDAYIEEAVAERLLQLAEQKFVAGELNDSQEYKPSK